MRTIWKFEIKSPRATPYMVPVNSRIVAVAKPPGAPFPSFWAEVDSEAELHPIVCEVFGAGHPIPQQLQYLGTFFDEPFVWHLYQHPRV